MGKPLWYPEIQHCGVTQLQALVLLRFLSHRAFRVSCGKCDYEICPESYSRGFTALEISIPWLMKLLLIKQYEATKSYL